jgi:hypothetical protein
VQRVELSVRLFATGELENSGPSALYLGAKPAGKGQGNGGSTDGERTKAVEYRRACRFVVFR